MKIINLAKKYRHLALVLIDVIVVIGSYVTSLLFLDTQITDLLEFTKEKGILKSTSSEYMMAQVK